MQGSGNFWQSAIDAGGICKSGRLYHMLAALGRAALPEACASARCAFATMLQAVLAIAERGIYRPRDCRNPSLIAPSTGASGHLTGAPENACQAVGLSWSVQLS